MESRVISEGPAVVQYNGFKYYTTDTITMTPDIKLRQMISAYFGPVDSRVTDKLFNFSFTPFGMMNNNAAAYFPFGSSDIGKLLMPDVDTPIYIFTSEGEKITIPAGMISKSPQLLLGTDKGPFGQMALAGLGDITAEDAAAAAHYTIETAAIDAHALDPDKAPTPAYKAVVTTAGTPDTTVDIDSEEGFTVDIAATLAPRRVNRYGTVNFKLTGLSPTAAFTPYNLTEAEIMAYWNIQGAGAAKLGASNKLGKKLEIKPANDGDKGITVTFPDFQIQSGSMLFGADDPRHGQYVFVPAVKVVAGVPQTLFSVAFPTWA